MLQLVLIRPGSTDYDLQQRIQGTLDMPLNEQGLVEARRIAEQLRDKELEVIYSPSSQPAEQTAKTIAEGLDIKARKLVRLQNLNQGLWQGMLIEDVRHKQPKVYRQWQEQPENVCPPQGEMLGEADERVHAAMAKLVKRHKEGVVGLVVPEPLLSLVRRFVTHAELGDLWTANEGRGFWEILQVEPEAAHAV
jgi:broad specificity phosphatase PhoE